VAVAVRDRDPLALGGLPGTPSEQENSAVTKKTIILGRESGKSSSRWFGGGEAIHPKGNGASTGDGRNSDTSILGKIVPRFLRG
jgi:hypothetical protein